MPAPCFYSPKFQPKPLTAYSLVDYLLEYYNLYDFEVFLIHGDSHEIGFIRELREDYVKICGSSNPRVVNDEDLFQDALDHEPPEEEIKVGEVIIPE